MFNFAKLEKITMKKAFLLLLFATFSLLNAHADDDAPVLGDTIKVEGTSLADIRSLYEIIQQIPGVRYNGSKLVVDGRGTPDVYVNNRKITDFAELYHIQGSFVQSVSVIRQPGAEYGKDVQSVILVRMKENTEEGLRLNEFLRFDLTNKLATNNEVSLGYKFDKLDIGAFVAWNETRHTQYKEDFNKSYEDATAVVLTRSIQNERIRRNHITTRFNLLYDISPLHRISLKYSYQQQPHSYADVNDNLIETFPVSNGVVNYDKPLVVVKGKSSKEDPLRAHMFDFEYRAFLGKWSVYVGNNAVWDNRISDSRLITDIEHNDEFTSRTYAKAEFPLWQGVFSMGAEYSHDELERLVDKGFPKDKVNVKNDTNTESAYLSLLQKFGRWTFNGGLRYEHSVLCYTPYEDDLTKQLLPDVKQIIEQYPGVYDDHWLIQLVKNGNLRLHDSRLYPSLIASVDLGNKHSLTLTHTQSAVRPVLKTVYVNADDIERVTATQTEMQRMMNTEHVITTTLAWKWSWLSVGTTHTYYERPICETTSGSDMYNGPAYNAFDVNISASPKIGFWNPMISVFVHKQWFDMPIYQMDRLNTPFSKIQWNNTFVLPHDWMITINGAFHSKGATRSTYYYNTNFALDASIQKSFLKKHLVLELKGVNMLNDSWDDVTIYRPSYTTEVSKGHRNRNLRMTSFSVRYML